jgi:BlaI family penicillinase repressor
VAKQTRSFLDRLFGGTLRPLVAHVAEHHQLTKKDITELKSLLDQIKPKS